MKDDANKILNPKLMHTTQWLWWGLIFGAWSLGAATAQEKHPMHVSVSGIADARGSLMVAVYDEKEHFLGEQAVLYRLVPVNQTGTLRCVLDLPLGTYAVGVYHDLNDNGELDTNFWGIPKEPTGCSRDAVGTLGPPPFEKAVFEFEHREQEVKVSLR